MKLLRRLSSRLAGFLNLSYLSREFLRFTAMHGLFSFATTLSGIFIGTFLFKAAGDFSLVGRYYLLAFSMEALCYLFVAGLGRRFSQTVLTRFGLLLYTASYLLLITLRQDSTTWYPLIAVCSALGASLYWLPYHSYTLSYTTPGNRQLGMSFLGLVGNLIVLIAPILSGVILRSLTGNDGYTAIFVVSVVSFLCAALVTRKMPSKPTDQPRGVLLELVRRRLKGPLMYMSLGNVFYGLRDGIFLYYLNVLLFSQTSDELVVGLATTARSVVALLVFQLVIRRLTPRHRLSGMLLCSLLSLGLSAGLLVSLSVVTVLLVTVLDAAFVVFNNNTIQYSSYEISDYLAREGPGRGEAVLGLRNFSLNVGRAIGLIVMLLVPSLGGGSPLILVALNAAALPAALLLRRADTCRRRGEGSSS